MTPPRKVRHWSKDMVNQLLARGRETETTITCRSPDDARLLRLVIWRRARESNQRGCRINLNGSTLTLIPTADVIIDMAYFEDERHTA